MSDLGDQLSDEYGGIEALTEGDKWATQYETLLSGVLAQLNAAAPDTIRDSATGSISADVNNQSVDSEEGAISRFNEEYRPKPGELQSVLQNATTGDVVRLWSGRDYDPGSETAVPQGVTLDCNGAAFRPTTDHDVLFLDSAASIKDLIVDFSNVTTATSRALRLSTAESAAGYAIQDETQVSVSGVILGNKQSEIGVEMVDDGNGIFGNDFDIDIIHCSIGLRGDPGGGFINGKQGRFAISDCDKGIVHDGTGNMHSYIEGIIEPSGTSTHAIQNNTTSDSVTLIGHVWDPIVFDTNSLEGPNIDVVSLLGGAEYIINTGDGDPSQNAVDFSDGFRVAGVNPRMKMMDPVNENTGGWALSTTGDRAQLELNKQLRFAVYDNGPIRTEGPAFFQIQGEDLTSKSPSRDEFAKHDGTGTPSESLCCEVDDGSGGSVWYNFVDGTTF